jgi:phage head maturation protease
MEYAERMAELRARVERIKETARRDSIKYKDEPVWRYRSKVLQGYACLYDVEHSYKGRREVFRKNCFSGSLYEVFFGIDHEYQKTKLGDQNDGSLELVDTDVGLAFRLAIAPSDLAKIADRDEVSVSYIEHDVEIRRDGLRVIKSASLFEISAVHVGAMRTTHAIVRDASDVDALAVDAKSGFAVDSAAMAFKRALQRLDVS